MAPIMHIIIVIMERYEKDCNPRNRNAIMNEAIVAI